MSFLFGDNSKLPDPPPKAMGVDQRRLSSNERARPVQYFAGKRRVAAHPITDVFDVKRQSVKREVGKQKEKVGENYFASFAALIGHGPLDGIQEFIFNGESVWKGNALRTEANPHSVKITIPDHGLATVYWGTETQPADAYLRNWSGFNHPPYRGFAYIVFKQILLGFNQTNVQNIEVVVTRYPSVSWLTTSPKIGVDANPIACAAEWMQHPRFGLGVSTDKVNTSAMELTAEQLLGEELGLSPWMVRAQEARQWLTHLLEYIDGYPDVEAGTLAIGLSREPSVLPLTVVDESSMTRRPEITPEEWSGTFNETHLLFSNPVLDWNDDPVTWRDRGNFQITGEFTPLRLDRPWVTNNVLATRMVKAAGRGAALPKCNGQLFLRRTASFLGNRMFDLLKPGALFLLTYTPRGYRDLLCRVQERTLSSPAAAEFSITFKLDRSYLNTVSVAEGGAEQQGPDDPPAAEQLVNAIVVELPLVLCPEGRLSLAVIAARPDTLTTGYKVHLGESYDFTGAISPTSYEVLETHNRFAAHGTLQADYPSTTEEIDFIGLVVKLDGVDLTIDEQSPFDGLADDLLVFIGEEVMSVHEVELVDVDTYRLRVIRGRFATARQSHTAGAEVYVINRSDLLPLQHAQFDVNNTAHFKLQASTGTQLADIADALVKTKTITGAIYKSTPPKNLRVNGTAVNPTYATGSSPLIEWTLTEAGRDHYQAGLLKVTTVLEFLNGSMVVVGTKTIAAGISSFQPTNGELIALLGGSEISFTLRAKTHTIADWFEASSASTSLAVTKV